MYFLCRLLTPLETLMCPNAYKLKYTIILRVFLLLDNYNFIFLIIYQLYSCWPNSNLLEKIFKTFSEPQFFCSTALFIHIINIDTVLLSC